MIFREVGNSVIKDINTESIIFFIKQESFISDEEIVELWRYFYNYNIAVYKKENKFKICLNNDNESIKLFEGILNTWEEVETKIKELC